MESPNRNARPNEEHDPTDDKRATIATNDTGAASGNPNMEPDTTDDGYGNGDTLGNNDGTEPDPERTDPVDEAKTRSYHQPDQV